MAPTLDIGVTDLGLTAYREAYVRQQAMLERVVASREGPAPIPGHIFLVEHPPVITVSARAGAAAHVIASARQLSDAGVAVEETDRGGDVTYHGPGQLVVYPIIDLNFFGLRLHEYMRLLEEVVIRVCTHLGVRTQRDPGATGVWVAGRPRATDGAPEGEGGNIVERETERLSGGKICAMGVRVRKWVSMHGMALNVAPNLDHFGLIVPCGLVGRSVTSLRAELGDRCPEMGSVKDLVVRELRDQLLNRVKG